MKLLHIATISIVILFTARSSSAQNALFTYQGRVTDNGTNFTGIGRFKFALVLSTNFNHQATAVANMGGVIPNQFVSSCTVIEPGSGYATPPLVSFSGGSGSGATANASVSGGKVNNITVLIPGSGYSAAPNITIAPPPPNISYTTFWSNDGTSSNGSEPISSTIVPVTNGLFTVVIGDTTLANMVAIPSMLFATPNLQLQLWFSDGTSGFAQLEPLQNITPAPYAIQALNSATASNLIGTVPLAQLPVVVLTNNATGINLNGTFTGDGAGLAGTITSKNFISGFDTSVQPVLAQGVQQPISFGGFYTDGWTYSSLTTNFVCAQSGTYLFTYDAVAKAGSTSSTLSIAAYNQGVEIIGSEAFVTPVAAGQSQMVSKTFLRFINGGNSVQFRMSANSADIGLAPSLANTVTKPSISVTIIRIQ